MGSSGWRLTTAEFTGCAWSAADVLRLRHVLSLGAQGALLATAEGAERFAAIPVEARSTVGAGDSMLAGIVLGLSRGLPLRDAVRFGMAAGAAALLGSGTQLCRRSDVERLYAGREYLRDA
jgi:fructose-1-phosphate kinase PfkB-like protein